MKKLSEIIAQSAKKDEQPQNENGENQAVP